MRFLQLVVVALAMCESSGAGLRGSATDGKTSPTKTKTRAEIVKQVAALVDELTTEEKYSLMNGAGYDGWTQFDGYYIGNTPAIPRLSIPSLKLQDAGQGFRTNDPRMIGQVTSWSCALGLATSWDPDLVAEWASAVADEYLAKGANVILGPGLNVHRVARGGRNAEYMSGEEPFLGASFAAPFINGFQSKGILTTMKHFGLNNQEDNRGDYSADVDARTLYEVYYPPYQSCVDAGVASAMCSYNRVNGTHSCSSDQLLNDDLKKTMGFEGFVMSDWGAVHATTAAQGLDQDMPGSNVDGDSPGDESWFAPDRLDAVSSNVIDEAVSRVLWPVVQYGLIDTFDSACQVGVDCEGPMYEVDATSDDHTALALKIATESVLLLKNDDDVLPFAAAAPANATGAPELGSSGAAAVSCVDEESDYDYAGNDLSYADVGSAAECCDGCAAVSGCAAYTFYSDEWTIRCYYKSSAAGRVYSPGKGLVSATLGGGDDDLDDGAFTVAVVGSACAAENNIDELTSTCVVCSFFCCPSAAYPPPLVSPPL